MKFGFSSWCLIAFQHLRSFRVLSVNLTTLVLGKPPRQLPVLSVNSFASN